MRELHADADFPHRLRITVNSYDPIGSMEIGGRSVAIARDGTVLDGTPTKGLTVIAATGSAAGTKITGTEATKLVRLLAAAPAPLRSRALARVQGPGRSRGRSARRPAGGLRGPHTVEAKWLSRRAVLADADSRGASYVDVRLPERPVAGPLPARRKRTGRTLDLALSLMANSRHSSCSS